MPYADPAKAKAQKQAYYQLLCWNCNLSKHFGGGVCAHKRRS